MQMYYVLKESLCYEKSILKVPSATINIILLNKYVK